MTALDDDPVLGRRCGQSAEILHHAKPRSARATTLFATELAEDLIGLVRAYLK